MTENKTYIWSSETFTGSVLFTFNPEGKLLKYDNTEATLNDQQLQWFTERMPGTYDELKDVLSRAKHSKLEALPDAEITFDLFWNRYDEKIRSSKKKSLIIWNRIKDNDRRKAYLFIGTYERSIRSSNTAKKYAETYLNAELWNN